MSHRVGAKVLVDGAQAASHIPLNMQDLDADFYCFSAHKMYGPTGVGVLYGKEKSLNELPPYQGGGEMIEEVSFEKTTYADLPHKFEAGTPNIAGVIAFKNAIEFITDLGMENIAKHIKDLLKYATSEILKIEGVKIYGTSEKKSGIISFNIKELHPYDIGMILDKLGVAIRTGHHCTQPVMNYYKIPGTARISFALYNSKSEIDTCINAIKKAKQMLS
jgi:cysteine desulfurase/selenocysteine lyase